ncbi:MAG: DUF4143 domain-containing protein [Nitrospira sp.]|nr:DUF4143 domain-containing protein [Nitrospira sp.]
MTYLCSASRFRRLPCGASGLCWPTITARSSTPPELGRALGTSHTSIRRYLAFLANTFMVRLLQPWAANLAKRQIRHPKVYLADSGLACHLLGIDSPQELARSPFLGTLFEGFMAAEIVKAQINAGRRPELYYFRDEQGLEVDFLVPGRQGAISLVECKATRTPVPSMAVPMQRLAQAMKKKHRARGHRDVCGLPTIPRCDPYDSVGSRSSRRGLASLYPYSVTGFHLLVP